MGNSIKYTTGTEVSSLSKGNFRIGTGDVGKGPTSSTGFYQASAPPSNGYRVYSYNTAVSGNISYYNATNDSDLINYTNNTFGQSFTGVSQCLVYYVGQNDKSCFNREYEAIVTSGMVLNLDAGFVSSYPTSGTTWYDVSPSGNTGTLINGPTYSSTSGGTINFDGTDDYVSVPNSNSLYLQNAMTIQFFVKINNLPPSQSGNRMWLVTKGESNQFEWQTTINNFSSDLGKWCFIRYAATTNGGTLNGGSFRGRVSSSDAVAGVWTNVAFTLASPSSFADIYINGSLNNGNTLSQNTMNVEQGTANVRLGTRDFGEKYFDGSFGDVLIYNRALSSAEILQNYNAMKGRYGL